MQHTEQASCAHNHARIYDPDPQAVGSSAYWWSIIA